jgi:hypothetical protein
MGIMREDGTQEVNPLQKLEAGMEISLKDYEKLTPADMFKRLQEQMQDFQLKKSKALFDKLRKTTEEVGHVSNLHGQPLTGEFLIESYKKLHIDFEGDGTPRMPTIVCGSEAKQVFERAIKEIQDNPELARKFAAVIDEKRREWRDRESSRKLVG